MPSANAEGGGGLKGISWEPPTEIQLAENRLEFRNVYGYANDFLA